MQCLEDGDPVAGIETETSIQALANRTAYLQTALNVDANETIQLIGGAAATKATITSSGANGHEGINAGGHLSAAGVKATGGATGPGVTAIGGATSGAGLVATATGGNSDGITATGHGSGYGVHAIGLSGGGAAVRAEALDASVCVSASAAGIALGVNIDRAGGRGMVINIGTGALAPLFIATQASVPSGDSLVGDLYVTTAGVLKICTVAGTGGGATWVSVGAQV